MNNVKLDSLRQRALIACAAGIVLTVIGGLISGHVKFFQSYLFAFIFWNGLGLGCLSALMLHHLVGGRWGFMIQRILEAGARNIIVMAILFLPILAFGVYDLYPWVPGGALAASTIVQAKAAFLNVSGFRIRSLIYFAIWIGLAYQLIRQSRLQDQDSNPRRSLYLRWTSGPGLVIYVLSLTLASTDWGMSLEPEWFSTIYGAIYIVGHGLTALAFSIIILSKLADSEPHAKVMSVQYYDDLAGLMCAFVVLWSYMSFSQFLITWSGNLPEEIPWYLHRTGAALNTVAVILILFHFAIPMFILFQKRIKRSVSKLIFMCYWILVARVVDVFWWIKPAFTPQHLALNILDLAALLAIGGLWVALFAGNLKKYPVLPLHDPRFEEALHHIPGESKEAVEHA